MKQILIMVVAALAGGAGGAYLIHPSDEAIETDSLAVGMVDELRAQVELLEVQNRSLLARVDSLEHGPRLSDGPARQDATVALTNPQADIAELRDLVEEALKNPASPTAPILREQVSNVVKELREQEEAEREAQRKKDREEAAERRVSDMAKELGLNAYQTEVLRKSMADAEAAMMALRDNRDGTGGDFRETMDKVREDTKSALGAVFTPEQMSTFEEKYSNGRFLFGGGRGGGFGGGGRGGFGGGRGGG